MASSNTKGIAVDAMDDRDGEMDTAVFFVQLRLGVLFDFALLAFLDVIEAVVLILLADDILLSTSFNSDKISSTSTPTSVASLAPAGTSVVPTTPPLLLLLWLVLLFGAVATTAC